MAYSKEWKQLEIKLSLPILQTIKELKFKYMTPVQAICIPLFQSKKDVAAEAVTGSGKTLAFLIPALEIMIRRQAKWGTHEVGAIVISPTRELAQQISDVLDSFIKHLYYSQLLLVGGGSVENDIRQFQEKGANIIVATPGRLEDLLIHRQGVNLNKALKSLEMLVLDEADRLLDLGFQSSLDNILKLLPRQRRTGLFSATQTKEVENLMRAGLRNPVVVSVKEKVGHQVSTPTTLTNFYTICEVSEKFNALCGFLLSQGSDKKFIVFMSTCAAVEWFFRVLSKMFKDVFCIHRTMGQKRGKVLQTFRDLNSGILLCTDLMARGIDILDIDWVIQFDPPSNAAAFVHRVGRTARCGRLGFSLLFLLPSEDAYIDFIRKNQRVDLVKKDLDWDCQDVNSAMKELQVKDRTNFDLAMRAFVSYVQSYAKHECSLIFRVKDLPFGQLANCFGLLRLPHMPELKNSDITGFSPANIDFNSIPYADKAKEDSRQNKLQIYFETKKWPTGNDRKRCKPTVPWEQSKKRKLEKREKKKNRKERKKKSKALSQEEIDDLVKDVALIKKMKKKKISNADFDKEFAEIAD